MACRVSNELERFGWWLEPPRGIVRSTGAFRDQQNMDESHEDFISRVEATAQAQGSRVVFIDNIRDAGLI